MLISHIYTDTSTHTLGVDLLKCVRMRERNLLLFGLHFVCVCVFIFGFSFMLLSDSEESIDVTITVTDYINNNNKIVEKSSL